MTVGQRTLYLLDIYNPFLCPRCNGAENLEEDQDDDDE
jgi:hypothetical protein